MKLSLDYFDGRSARAQPVQAWLAEGQLHIEGAAEARRYAQDRVSWPERQRHGQRQALLPDGGVLSGRDAAAWDDWTRAAGMTDSVTVRWVQNWQRVALAAVLLVGLLGAIWRWGVPLAADGVLAITPPEVESAVGEQALTYFDRGLLKPSGLPAERQQALRQRLTQVLSSAAPGSVPVAYRLHFRDGGKALGPNAFALPGGDIVVTDALVTLMADEPDAVIGVIGHELGHVRHRHGLRITVQAGITGVLAGLVVGDYSSALAGVPALLAQQSYSRDFERQADEHARQTLRAAGISPRVMQHFFTRLAAERSKQRDKLPELLPIAFSSHPADEERIRFFAGD